MDASVESFIMCSSWTWIRVADATLRARLLCRCNSAQHNGMYVYYQVSAVQMPANVYQLNGVRVGWRQ